MPSDGELKLLGLWASPFVTRAKLALQIKGLSYEYVEEDLANKSELLLSSNPVHKDGKPYIDEAFAGTGPSLLPVDPYERAVARFWAAYLEDKLVTPWGRVFRVKTEEERAEAMMQTIAAVDALEGGLEECSGGKGSFFGGESVGYVDVLLGGLVSWVKATELLSGAKIIDAAKAPLLAAWMERFCELDVAKAVLQDVGAVVDYATAVQARSRWVGGTWLLHGRLAGHGNILFNVADGALGLAPVQLLLPKPQVHGKQQKSSAREGVASRPGTSCDGSGILGTHGNMALSVSLRNWEQTRARCHVLLPPCSNADKRQRDGQRQQVAGASAAIRPTLLADSPSSVLTSAPPGAFPAGVRFSDEMPRMAVIRWKLQFP
ncbi:hypothetical protein HU200_018480 [Digitaria exilis]|uniref:glutathione transferase n=1 Tax=Digitaria exilis TaxID=1010633 RepID=A0A835F4C5_9POAL|nr:hypothetical protein HU200_018480 [Digitaria exilis]